MRTYFNELLQQQLSIPSVDAGILAKETIRKKFVKKEKIPNEGEICKEGFFVEKGLLKAFTIDNTGKEHIIQFASEGWFIADRSSMHLNQGSILYIDAIEDTEVIAFSSDWFAKIALQYPAIGAFNEMLLHKHIASLQFRINQLLSATAEERYLNFIDLYPDLLLRIPQWMIASYLGITPESLSRVRKELAERHQRQKSK